SVTTYNFKCAFIKTGLLFESAFMETSCLFKSHCAYHANIQDSTKSQAELLNLCKRINMESQLKTPLLFPRTTFTC
uniref:Uncharacterized protein n=1 Tax=Anabas testudineus TaxID=64144 RepID=A0A7N6B4E9_ANATE